MTAIDVPTDLTDPELISQVREGDVTAYGTLFSRHVDAATRLAQQLVHGPDADDLVSEAFVKVLNVLLGGGGPDVAFRAYLLTAVRRLHVDKIRSTARATPTEDLTPYDPGVPFTDTAVSGFEGGAAAKAFASLPERWQLVLWHLEVENQKPAEIAPLLGMSANSVSALAYRAREGLRQAFLQLHGGDLVSEGCRTTHELLGGYVRGGLSKRDAGKVEDHLDQCRRCTGVYLELAEVNTSLAGVLGPAVLGVAAAGYLGGGAGAVGGGAGALALLGRGRDFVLANTAATATAGAVGIAAATAIAIGIVQHHGHAESPTAAAVGGAGTTGRTTASDSSTPTHRAAPHRVLPRQPAPHLAATPHASTATPSSTAPSAVQHSSAPDPSAQAQDHTSSHDQGAASTGSHSGSSGGSHSGGSTGGHSGGAGGTGGTSGGPTTGQGQGGGTSGGGGGAGGGGGGGTGGGTGHGGGTGNGGGASGGGGTGSGGGNGGGGTGGGSSDPSADVSVSVHATGVVLGRFGMAARVDGVPAGQHVTLTVSTDKGNLRTLNGLACSGSGHVLRCDVVAGRPFYAFSVTGAPRATVSFSVSVPDGYTDPDHGNNSASIQAEDHDHGHGHDG